MTIKKLPDKVINSIAAGEIVERPSSIVKELMENSIDAKATDIKVIVNNGGKTYISVRDNGIGMTRDEIHDCIKRHYTSKIQTINDLNNIHTLGFRGEGLFAICHVADIFITSKKETEEFGTKVHISNGQIQSEENLVCSTGTHIEVENLFFNLPARLKFLRSDQWEFTNIHRVYKNMVLSHPNIHFSLTKDGNITHESTHSQGLIDKIEEIYGKSVIQSLIYGKSKEEKYSLDGYLQDVLVSTSLPLTLIVNRRVVNDNKIASMIAQARKKFAVHHNRVGGVLNIELPSEEIDVNVHPNKMEIKFRDVFVLQNLISEFIKNVYERKDHNVILNWDKSSQEEVKNNVNNHENSNNGASFLHDSKCLHIQEDNHFNNIATEQIPNEIDQNLDMAHLKDNFILGNASDAFTKMCFDGFDSDGSDNNGESHDFGKVKCQIFNSYILTESKDYCYIIDQHAAHERILLEKNKNSIFTQKQTIVTKIIILNQSFVERLKNLDKTKIPMCFDILSENSILVSSLPSFYNKGAETFFKELEKYTNEQSDNLNINHVFQNFLEIHAGNMCCHNGITFNEFMSRIEMENFIHDLSKISFNHLCNHGRKTFIKISKKSLAAMFSRNFT